MGARCNAPGSYKVQALRKAIVSVDGVMLVPAEARPKDRFAEPSHLAARRRKASGTLGWLCPDVQQVRAAPYGPRLLDGRKPPDWAETHE